MDGIQKTLRLRDVLHVPQLKRKLISISAATDNRCDGVIEKDKIIIRRNGDVKLVAIKLNGLYFVSVSTKPEINTVSEEKLHIWHRRFGHINRRTIQEMVKKNVVDGLEGMPSEVSRHNNTLNTIDCEACCQGKMSKLPTPSSTRDRAKEIGESLHNDICGANYIDLLKDEFSNFRFVYCLKSREEAFDCLKQTVSRMASETKKPVRQLVTDRGSEYTSNRSKEFLLNNNIVHKTSIPFVAAQNGFVERENRTLLNGVRTMLYHNNVPLEFWEEAVNTFVYLLNRSLNTNLTRTPYEIHYGVKPRVIHSKVFGCTAYVKTRIKKRSG